jgi:hypothetical protein
MLLLDEQLMGCGIGSTVAEWYPGPVRFVRELRPGAVVRDDAVPFVLSRENSLHSSPSMRPTSGAKRQ